MTPGGAFKINGAAQRFLAFGAHSRLGQKCNLQLLCARARSPRMATQSRDVSCEVSDKHLPRAELEMKTQRKNNKPRHLRVVGLRATLSYAQPRSFISQSELPL